MRASSGFTVIETVLFLAITGLMIAVMFIGIGSSIGAQRYRDSVESFKSVLQQQYSELTNTYNGRESGWACRPVGARLLVGEGDAAATLGNASPRGQSDCAVVGRYMTIDGGTIRTFPVLAHVSGQPTGTTDIAKLRSAAYVFGIWSGGNADYQLEWGTRIAWPTGSSPSDPRPASTGGGDRKIAILFLRSPDSGSVYTFSSNTVISGEPSSTQIKAMIIESATAIPGRAARLLCVDSTGLVITPNRGVFIDAQAGDSSAIRVSLPADFSGAQSC